MIGKYQALHQLNTVMMCWIGDRAARRVPNEHRENIYNAVYKLQEEEIPRQNMKLRVWNQREDEIVENRDKIEKERARRANVC